MSNLRLSLALVNGGYAVTDTDDEGLLEVMAAMEKGTALGVPGKVVNGRHIVCIEVEEIKSV